MAERNTRKTGDVADGQSDVAGRNAASTADRGQSADGAAPAGNRMEAALQTAADSSVSPKSSTLQAPDAEVRADLTQDVLTANREAMQAEIRAGNGEDADLKKTQTLHQAVADAQAEVDAALAKRDAARDVYDRHVEAVATMQDRSAGAVARGYIDASNRQREAAAQERQRALAKAGAG